MVEWKSVVFTLGIVGLCFLGIPIKIDKNVNRNHLVFNSFIKKYNKSYEENSSEYNKRFENFQEALKTIQDLNSQRSGPGAAIYGFTEFSDLSQAEFADRHLRKGYYKHLRDHRKHLIRGRHNKSATNHIDKRSLDGSLPPKVDWREKHVITPVKNQKTCGACWAFSVLECVESMSALKYGYLKILSVQQVIDCARNGNFGCGGGDTCSLLEWLAVTRVKVQLEKDYPLVLKTGECKDYSFASEGVVVASNYSCDYLIGSEEELMAILAYHGPVAVAVNALPWQFYLGGVIQYHCDGSLLNINHAVQIVGYDTTAAIPHYIVRNSWGTTFGDKGYLKIAIGNNTCGIATEVTSMNVV